LKFINLSTDDIVRSAIAQTNPEKPDTLVIASLMKRIVNLGDRLGQIEKEIIAIEIAEFKVIRERNAKRELYYQYATWASYFLYPLGLLIGLFARLSEQRRPQEPQNLDEV